jgi:Zn-dependent M28 family amino/carboxypeptidase
MLNKMSVLLQRVFPMGLLCLAILLTAHPASAQRAAMLRERTAAIAEGKDSEARRRAITDYLQASGVEYRLEPFEISRFSGTNIVVDVPGPAASKTFLLSAHYDRVAVGQGAVDNAASCAVLLSLLSQFKSSPLQKYSLRVVFFDSEEIGLVGSQAYLASIRERGFPAGAINLDIFGYGDTLFATSSELKSPLAAALQQAAEGSSIAVRLVEPQRYPASDHRPMITAGIETLGVALIDGAEIDAILQPKGAPPRILTIIHSTSDAMDKIRPDDMEKAAPVIEKTIRLIDQR